MSSATASLGALGAPADLPRGSAPLLEVFRSIQGEGRYLGQPQVFVRLRGCPMRCRYCDTPQSWVVRAGQTTAVEAGAEERQERSWSSPLETACYVVAAEAGGPALTVSLTGGEPLQWPGFVRALAPLLGDRRLHLETAGAHPRTLASLLALVDHVSLDLKLPSDLDAPVELPRPTGVEAAALGLDDDPEPAPSTAAQWRAARRGCLDLVAGRDACAKLVVTAGSSERECYEALDDLAEIAPDLALIVQPATAMGRAEAPDLEFLRTVWEYALEIGLDPRVVPQVHRALAVR